MAGRSFRCIAALCVACALFAGCPEHAQLRDRVFVAERTPGLHVAGRDVRALTLRLDAEAPALQPGDIVAGAEGGGYLRRITRVHRRGAELIAETEEAAVPEAVKQGAFAKNIEFTTEDFQDAGILPENAPSTLIEFNDVPLFTAAGLEASIERAALDCAPQLYLGAFYNEYRLTRFSLVFDAEFTLDMDFRLGVDQARHVWVEENLLPPVNHPFVTHIGILPIVGNAQVRYVAGIAGNFAGDTSLRTGFDVATTFSIGGNYRRGEWERVLGFSPIAFQSKEPVFTVEVGANVTFYIAVELEVSLYNAAQANVAARPYVNACIEAWPLPLRYILSGGFTGEAGYSLNIFCWELFGDSFTYQTPYLELAYFSSNGY